MAAAATKTGTTSSSLGPERGLSRAFRRVELALGAGRNFRSVANARPVAKAVVIRSSSARVRAGAGVALQQQDQLTVARLGHGPIVFIFNDFFLELADGWWRGGGGSWLAGAGLFGVA